MWGRAGLRHRPHLLALSCAATGRPQDGHGRRFLFPTTSFSLFLSLYHSVALVLLAVPPVMNSLTAETTFSLSGPHSPWLCWAGAGDVGD